MGIARMSQCNTDHFSIRRVELPKNCRRRCRRNRAADIGATRKSYQFCLLGEMVEAGDLMGAAAGTVILERYLEGSYSARK
jgi:hypothetical protein